ncbi:sensor histidine kinase [Pseudoroseomonas wenyumeiae]
MGNALRGLCESEERLRSAAEVGQLGLWDWNVRTNEIHWSDEHFRMEGYRVGEVTPSYETWAARLHPEDRKPTEAALRKAIHDRTEYSREFRVVHPDGTVRWLYCRGRFCYDGEGLPTRMIGAMVDTTERREWEERQKVLVAELQHRTRNLLSVIRAVADKTLRRARDLNDFKTNFRDRLGALDRVQRLLSRLDEHDRITFDELIQAEMSAHGVVDGVRHRIVLEGPLDVRLRSSTVQILAMGLHELATNAAKYGALKQPQGQLAVRWQLVPRPSGPPWLEVVWQESGVIMPPAGSAPQGTGQGRELIEKALPYQLGAKTTYELGPDGICCTILMPTSTTGTKKEANA